MRESGDGIQLDMKEQIESFPLMTWKRLGASRVDGFR